MKTKRTLKLLTIQIRTRLKYLPTLNSMNIAMVFEVYLTQNSNIKIHEYKSFQNSGLDNTVTAGLTVYIIKLLHPSLFLKLDKYIFTQQA